MKLPDEVKQAWEKRAGPVVLTTVDPEGQPNAIYVLSISLYGGERIVIADNYFDKTRRNIQAGSLGSVLFITNDKRSFQLKGVIEYHEEGPFFAEMKRCNPAKHPGHAAAVLLVREIYSGSKKLES